MGQSGPRDLKLAIFKTFFRRGSTKEDIFEDSDPALGLRASDHGRLKNFILLHAA